MVKKTPNHHTARHVAALAFASLDVILILHALIRQLPKLEPEFLIPFPQVLLDANLWFTIAEISFCCSVYVALYCLISLWIPDIRSILWIGAGSVIGSGVLYLVAAIMYYREAGMGVPFQQGLFMFLLSLMLPILVVKLSRYICHRQQKDSPLVSSTASISMLGETN